MAKSNKLNKIIDVNSIIALGGIVAVLALGGYALSRAGGVSGIKSRLDGYSFGGGGGGTAAAEEGETSGGAAAGGDSATPSPALKDSIVNPAPSATNTPPAIATAPPPVPTVETSPKVTKISTPLQNYYKIVTQATENNYTGLKNTSSRFRTVNAPVYNPKTDTPRITTAAAAKTNTDRINNLGKNNSSSSSSSSAAKTKNKNTGKNTVFNQKTLNERKKIEADKAEVTANKLYGSRRG